MRLAAIASRLKRATNSGSRDSSGSITFTAIALPSSTCSARYTSPMPPAASLPTTLYRPSMMVPGAMTLLRMVGSLGACRSSSGTYPASGSTPG